MSEPYQDYPVPSPFSGRVRLFPLPNLVMFPHVIQPLHVFEPRYVKMVEASLADDQLLAMALLQPGWEPKYDERPPIHPVVCIGRVVSHNLLADGKYNLILQGLWRATIIRETPLIEPFRVAEVSVLEDLYPAAAEAGRGKLHRELIDCFRGLLPASSVEQAEQLENQEMPLGVLTDLVAYSLELGLEHKQKLLGEWNVDLRASMLLERLQAIAIGGPRSGSDPPFPPDFSLN